MGKDHKSLNTFQVLLHTSKLFSRAIKFGYTATSSTVIVFSLVVGIINFGTGKITLFLYSNYSWCLNIFINIHELLHNMAWSYFPQKTSSILSNAFLL